MDKPLSIQGLCYRPGTALPLHHHASATLSLILEGEQRESVGRRFYDCSSLSAVLKGPGIEHTNHVGARATRGLFVELSDETERELRGAQGASLGAVCFLDGTTRHIVRRIRQELRLRLPGAAFVVEGLVFELLGTLSRRRKARLTPRGDAALRRAVDYLEANYRSRLTLAEVSQRAGVHPSYLAELFRATYSVSLGEWVRHRRLEHARQALQSSAVPISAIAFQAGFADQSHLSRLFRARYGLTPAEYRQNPC